MNQKDRNEAYMIFIEQWGSTAQMIMVIEETAELQKEVTKYLRGRENKAEILEEIADVEIMLEQLKFMFDIKQSLIDEQKERKINRALSKINNYTV